MALPAIIAGAAVICGLTSMYSKNREISAQKDSLKAQAALARRNGMNARSGFYAQGNRFALSAELETGRMARSHAQRIGSMRASIGGSGAVADSGTTWDVIIAQDTENQAEMNAFRNKIESRSQDFFDQGEAQYMSYMNQANSLEDNAMQLERSRIESVFLSGLGGAANFASMGASLGSSMGYGMKSPSSTYQPTANEMRIQNTLSTPNRGVGTRDRFMNFR